MIESVKIGLLGLGTVGSGVWQLLARNRRQIVNRCEAELEIAAILVRDLDKKRAADVPRELLTTEPGDILDNEDIQVVVELVGGIDPALSYVRQALEKGKHVVTANKAIMARYGGELLAIAAEQGVDLFFEASVGGGIPIIKPLSECLAANRIQQLMGIINGTTNYMLTNMTRSGAEFEEVLRQAQALGYAEADPSSDVEGIDAAHKLAILCTLAFETPVTVDNVYVEGITHITPIDIAFAGELGYVVKLVAIGKEVDGQVEARVHPTFLPKDHPLAAVNDVYNAVFVTGDAVGDLMFYGRGAGDMPTASAVVGDLVEVVRNMKKAVNWRYGRYWEEKPIRPIGEITNRYYLRFLVDDRPGVLGAIASTFGREGVSVESVIQRGRHQFEPVNLVFITHEVQEANLRRALAASRELPAVKEISSVIRVEGGRD